MAPYKIIEDVRRYEKSARAESDVRSYVSRLWNALLSGTDNAEASRVIWYWGIIRCSRIGIILRIDIST